MLLYPSLKQAERCYIAAPDKMTNLMTDLETCTDEELENALARVLVYAAGEVLNEAEMRIFYQLYEEMRRRLPAVTCRVVN